MAERRETNLHEALQKYQLEVAWYTSAYKTEKREKERLIGAHFQQMFPSTITGGFEVSPAPQIQVLYIAYYPHTPYYRFRVALCSLAQLVSFPRSTPCFIQLLVFGVACLSYSVGMASKKYSVMCFSSIVVRFMFCSIRNTFITFTLV